MFKLFKKKTTKTIIGLDSLYEPPKRDSLSEKELILLEEIKEKFNEILRQNKTIVSSELDFNNLYESIIMNTDLLFSTVIEDDFKISLKLSKERDDKINLLKMKLYQMEIATVEKEATIKYIALAEILKKKRYMLFPSKIAAIRNALDTLKNTIYLCKSQKATIEIYIQNYLKDIEFKTIEENHKDIDLAYMLARNVLGKKFNEIWNSKNSPYLKMAKLIRELEIYAYEHKNDEDKLEQELNYYYSHLTKDNVDDFLLKIYNLGYRFLTLAKYGKRIITEEFMETFYRVQLYISSMALSHGGHKIHYFNQFEKATYEKVIFEHIHEIVTSDLPTDVIEGFKKFIKKDGKIDVEEILEDPFKLGIIMNLMDKESLNIFMENYHINPYDVEGEEFSAHKVRLTLLNETPLKTFIWLLKNQTIFKNTRLSFLTHFIEYTDEQKYYIPEGIEEFHGGIMSSFKENIRSTLTYSYDIPPDVLIEAFDKIMVLPDSMRSMDLYGLRYTIKGIEANKELNVLKINLKKEYTIEYLKIPTSLSSLIINDCKSINNLCIYDLDNDLNKWQIYKILINKLFYTKLVYYIEGGRKARKKLKEWWLKADDFAPVGSIVDKLTLIKKNGISVTIDLNDFGQMFAEECYEQIDEEEVDDNYYGVEHEIPLTMETDLYQYFKELSKKFETGFQIEQSTYKRMG